MGLDGQSVVDSLMTTCLDIKNKVIFRAGGSKVHVSVPAKELMERRHKARGMLNAIKVDA